MVENFHDVKIQPHKFLIYDRNDGFTTPTRKSTTQNNIDETACKSEGKQKYAKGFTPPDSSGEDSAGIDDEEFYVRYDYQNLPIVNFEFNAIRNVYFLDENLHLAFIHPHAITLHRG